MEALLKLEHKDFELLVSCNSYDRIFRKAAACMRVAPDSDALKSYYTWNDDNTVLTCKGNTIEKVPTYPRYSLKIPITNIGYGSRHLFPRHISTPH